MMKRTCHLLVSGAARGAFWYIRLPVVKALEMVPMFVDGPIVLGGAYCEV